MVFKKLTVQTVNIFPFCRSVGLLTIEVLLLKKQNTMKRTENKAQQSRKHLLFICFRVGLMKHTGVHSVC